MLILDALRHHARMRPFDLAVVHPRGAFNFLQLAGSIESLQHTLRANGIAPGMRVGIYVLDPMLHLGLVLACMLNGNASYSAHPNYEGVPPALKLDAYLADRALPFTPDGRVINVAREWLNEAMPASAPALAGAYFAPDALCRIFTSSGTTGTAKAIGYTAPALEALATRGLTLEPVSRGPNLSMMWFSTIGGFGTAQSTLWHGATLVLATQPVAVLRSINLYKVASMRVSPQQLQGLVDTVRGHAVRFPSLERVEVGGASTATRLVVAARATLCTNIVGVYGATEVGLVAQAPSSLFVAQSEVAGFVVPGGEVRIVDDSGMPVAEGAEGHVQVRTPSMASGYIGDEEATRHAFRDGWFVPGDVGTLGRDGLLRIHGRSDEMINAGGVKLNPAVVDEFLLTQPGIADAATFAYRRPGLSDQVWAAVVPGPGFDEPGVLAAARARLNSRAPVRLLPMEAIPRNAMGKAQRQQLSEQTSRAND